MANNIHTKNSPIVPLDLRFQDIPEVIGAYLIPHQHGAVLVECGPASTIPALQAGLHSQGYTVGAMTDVLITHVHLDHSGAAGWLAQQGARIHVHQAGAPHLRNPEKLLASAKRIYGEMMEVLWGETLPVPAEQIISHQDGDVIEVDELKFQVVETPGHASHHQVYIFQEACFSGDIGGVRLPNQPYVRLPLPPPDFNLEQWRASLMRLKHSGFSRIIPTHFGIFEDADWHLSTSVRKLDEIEDWMVSIMPLDMPIEQLVEKFVNWSKGQEKNNGMSSELMEIYEAANPTWMSAYGIQRYWRKHRLPNLGLLTIS